ncbi:Pentatricopeptide repeat (PPR) superfamily protein, putative isoform 1 [Hibiscus syriacus]|uniref:Pentatricopeptide repeat (PPR) superfamily protein, putative isoform 1 n=1 Tax=Hibiscus syriacus TaxID=106335 RepID=A0A6A2YEE0_HIBSY|nr:Pentatricopeptide repeat (PPR) superfamily protein, putative isoform 1 [Hibiscus syriacus]
MGTFVGHLVPGLTLTLIGLWHTINNIRAYCLKGSTKFTVRFWYPLHGHVSRFKHLELIFILAFSMLAIFMQILDLPFIRFPFELDGLEHASIFVQLAIMFLPTSLPAVLVLSVYVVFQGCWFMNMGFMLWSPQFVPRGCIMQLAESSGDNMHGAVTCFSHEAVIRARALANL